MTGETISHFKVLEKIGAGGMGEVYLAEDTKLDRQVALKVLPPHALASEDDRARFYREARAAAALNHANIGHVYEIDEAMLESGETRPFIAMEYVDGESLAERIARGPLPLQDMIAIGSQIASGLSAAHAKNIVHRDVKPSNVMLTKAGEAKILDFGLAKTAASTKLTRMGSTLGTFAYMSPEQARGEEVDARTDVWSLGALLYEMITGHVPFPGEYEQAVVYAILNEEPEPPTALRTGVPMELERIVMKCLSKDRRQRYQHVEEVGVDLGRVNLRAGGATAELKTVDPIGSERRLTILPWSLAALMTIVAVVLAWFLTQPATPRPVERWTLTFPQDAPLALVGTTPSRVGAPALAFDPDGSQLVYVVERSDGTTKLYRRAMNEREATPIPGTEGAYFPFFSPDGVWVGFFAEERLKKVSIRGGQPVVLCEVSHPWGAVWMPDDRIVFANLDGHWLSQVEASGGVAQRLLPSMKQVVWPTTLPGGTGLIGTLGPATSYRGLTVVSLDTGQMKSLVIPGVSAGIGNSYYIPTGHIIFALPGRIMAVQFDLDRLEVTGAPFPVVDQVRTERAYGATQFAVSMDGKLAYVPGTNASLGELVWVDEQGREEALSYPPAHYGMFKLSPEGRRLAISVLDGKWDIWIYDLETSNRIRLTKDGNNYGPLWTPDGDGVVFRSDRDGPFNIYWKRADSMGKAERLAASENAKQVEAFAPDGRLIYGESTETWNILWMLSITGERGAQPLTGLSEGPWGLSFSPGGQYVAYASSVLGQTEVYVQPFSSDGRREKISIDGGAKPIWSPIGNMLFYRHSNGRHIMVVPVATDPAFEAGTPQVFAEGPYLDVPWIGHDVAPDGRRMLLIKGSGVGKANRVNVVVNWFEELKHLDPTDETTTLRSSF